MDAFVPAVLAGSYVLGSIPFAYLAVRWLRGVDIRTVGSGNVGATNAGRILGRPAAVAIYVLDAGKGAGAILLARAALPANPAYPVSCGLLAIAGHVFPVWLRWKGGKGVATTTGVFAALVPAAFCIAAAVWIATAAITRYVSIASIALAVAFPVAFVVLDGREAVAGDLPILLLAAAAAIFISVRHIPNIRRIVGGTEPRIGARR